VKLAEGREFIKAPLADRLINISAAKVVCLAFNAARRQMEFRQAFPQGLWFFIMFIIHQVISR
jgi:hypothetical protein